MDNQDVKSVKRGIFLVVIANAISLCISLINGFILPKILPVESYADIKSYQLYASYIGVLALGYSDGVYLKYGGKRIKDITKTEINTLRANLLFSQFIIFLLFFAFSIIYNKPIVLLFSLSIIPVNLNSAYRNIFQATGEFSAYTKITNISTITNFVTTLFLLFVLQTHIGYFYVISIVLVHYLVYFLLERKLLQQYHYQFRLAPSLSDFCYNIKSGFILMLGNLSNILMTGIDRWFVKFFLSVADFAFYSFAVSTETLLNVFITPVITTMYNYICKNYMRNDLLMRIKKMCIIFSLFLISAAFPLKFILISFLVKYDKASNLIVLLFSTEVFYMVIKGIYVNYYKAVKMQSKYLKQMIAVLIIGSILNLISYFIIKSNIGFAVATLVSSFLWYLICSYSNKELRPDLKEYLLLSPLVAFFVCGFLLNPIIGFCVYIFITLFISYVVDKEDFMYIVNSLMAVIQSLLIKLKIVKR